MKAVAEKDHAGRTIWRVTYKVARRRVRKTFQTPEAANAWIASNSNIAVDEGRIFWETWNNISPPERHEVLDALSLMRAFRAKHPASTMTLVDSARNQIALVEAIETSISLNSAVERYLETKLNRKRKGSVSAGWMNVLEPCLRRLARELSDRVAGPS